MTEEERVIWDLLIEAHNKFVELDITHPNERTEWVDAIHKAQYVIGFRILRRDYKEDFK